MLDFSAFCNLLKYSFERMKKFYFLTETNDFHSDFFKFLKIAIIWGTRNFHELSIKKLIEVWLSL